MRRVALRSANRTQLAGLMAAQVPQVQSLVLFGLEGLQRYHLIVVGEITADRSGLNERRRRSVYLTGPPPFASIDSRQITTRCLHSVAVSRFSTQHKRSKLDFRFQLRRLFWPHNQMAASSLLFSATRITLQRLEVAFGTTQSRTLEFGRAASIPAHPHHT